MVEGAFPADFTWEMSFNGEIPCEDYLSRVSLRQNHNVRNITKGFALHYRYLGVKIVLPLLSICRCACQVVY